MIADIKKIEKGYIARFERHVEHPIEHVWAMLTDNEELEKWFQELRVGDPRKGGFMMFDMQDGEFEELEIFEHSLLSVLEFDWFGDVVRFELHPEQDGCLLIFKEKFETITEQRVKDLAGWHVCLDVIKSLLDGKSVQSREEEWKKWHSKYEQAVNELMIADKA
jgi:uncharacterized protein YndB with AHSA1/START domain